MLRTLNDPASTSAWYTAASGTRRQPRKRRSRSGSAAPSDSDSRPVRRATSDTCFETARSEAPGHRLRTYSTGKAL
jgi:hypothetical protein